MRFNATIFLENYRARIGALNQTQVDGLNFLLGAVAADERTTMVREFAYMLATVKGETSVYQPIQERRASPIRNPLLYARQGRYWKSGFYGRGFVQLTWERNYAFVSSQLRGKVFTRRASPGSLLDGETVVIHADTLVQNPDYALVPGAAYWIMSAGMHGGWFTTKKLSDYIREGQPPDYLNARRIINGTDKAAQFAHDAQLFELCLRASLIAQ